MSGADPAIDNAEYERAWKAWASSDVTSLVYFVRSSWAVCFPYAAADLKADREFRAGGREAALLGSPLRGRGAPG